MDCAGFYAAFASTLGYHSCFEEYGKVDFAVFAGVSAGANAGVIVGYYEEVFEDSGPQTGRAPASFNILISNSFSPCLRKAYKEP